MKAMFSFSGGIAILISLCLLIPTAGAQESNKLEVVAAAISKNVVAREAMDVGNRFSNSTPRLYCFTKIVGASQPTEVVHVWSYSGVERARISLAVKAASWRTYSSKAIQAHEMGPWRVDVLDTSGNLLETINFEITQ
jgi:zinc transporter ZupT